MTTPTLADRAIERIVASHVRVISELREGGMDAVYRVEQLSSSGVGALDVLPPQ